MLGIFDTLFPHFLYGSTYTKINLFQIVAPTVSKPKVKTFCWGWFLTIDKSFP